MTEGCPFSAFLRAHFGFPNGCTLRSEVAYRLSEGLHASFGSRIWLSEGLHASFGSRISAFRRVARFVRKSYLAFRRVARFVRKSHLAFRRVARFVRKSHIGFPKGCAIRSEVAFGFPSGCALRSEVAFRLSEGLRASEASNRSGDVTPIQKWQLERDPVLPSCLASSRAAWTLSVISLATP